MSWAERLAALLADNKCSRVTEVPPLSQTRNILFLACADPKSAEFKNRLLTVYPHLSMVLISSPCRSHCFMRLTFSTITHRGDINSIHGMMPIAVSRLFSNPGFAPRAMECEVHSGEVRRTSG